ncbi:MAG: SOS response-associated peptidase [Gammaproteobacteria bacterium]|nr:SOS response-associated peptidase [Gammaproteobacteria bacterium]
MCGRYTLYTKKEALEARFDAVFEATFDAQYNAAPSLTLPVIRNDNTAAFALTTWGFLPGWVRDFNKMKPQINARAESVKEKPYWRGALSKHRCLIPANGYYEWKKAGDRKQPYFIRLASDEPFAMAGLFDTYTNEAGQPVSGFAIITTQAPAPLANIHHRMPVILQPDDEARWLSPDLTSAEALSLLDVRTDVTAFPVSTRVNAPQNNSPELITPIELTG